MNLSTRPEIIIHMMSSVDGRIVPRQWSPFDRGTQYEDVHARLAGDAWICGRITMQGYTRGTPADDHDDTPVPRTDHRAASSGPYAIALDLHGRLHWGDRNAVDGDHVVVAVGERVSDAHLNALRASGVSYLFCGRDSLDLPRLAGKLKDALGIGRLLVEGGGGINGAFLQAGLVDEISLLLAPTVDGTRGTPAVFDTDLPDRTGLPGSHRLQLASSELMSGGVLWLRYQVTNGAEPNPR